VGIRSAGDFCFGVNKKGSRNVALLVLRVKSSWRTIVIVEVAGVALIKGSIAGASKKASSKLASDFYNKYIQPKFESRAAQKAVFDGLKKYIKQLEKATKHVPTIAIQGSLFELDEVYEPAILVRADDKEEFETAKFPQEIFDDEPHVLIVDSAGMGKSTFSKYLIRRAMESLVCFPVLIELRRVKKDQDLTAYISKELLGEEVTSACVKKLHEGFSDGDFLFIFDGYDELSEEMRQDVSSSISKMSSKYGSCKFLLTSRPDAGLASFPGYVQFGIKPLDLSRAYDLLRRYDKGKSKAEGLIQKIKLMPQMHGLLGNPLMVTLLYKAYDYRAIIPPKRNTFFRQVFEALFQDHDLSKEGAYERKKKSMLDMDDFHKVVRALGILTLKTGRIQYTAEEFVGLLSKSSDLVKSINVDVPKIKYDLLSAVPIFQKDGPDVRWSHKAFQDYFAAQFIALDMGDKSDDMIRHLLDDDNFVKYEGVLSLISEINIDLVRSSYLFPYFLEVDRAFLMDDLYGKKDDINFKLYFSRLISDPFMFDAKVFGDGLKPKEFGMVLDIVKERFSRIFPFRIAQLQSHAKGIRSVSFFNINRERVRILGILDPNLFDAGRDDLSGLPNLLADQIVKKFDGGIMSVNDALDDLSRSGGTEAKLFDWFRDFVVNSVGFNLPLRSKILDAKRRSDELESSKVFDDLLSM
jgi:hypothetical protein